MAAFARLLAPRSLPRVFAPSFDHFPRFFLSSSFSIPSSLSPQASPHVARRSHVQRLPVRASASSAEAGPSSSDSESEDSPNAALDAQGLQKFFEINSGQWKGLFVQFGFNGQPVQKIPVALSASASGQGDKSSLQQTLRIQPGPQPGDVIPVYEGSESWVEYKIPKMDRLMVDNRHQVGFFEQESAYAISHLTAEILGKVLRVGVLGEDAEDEDEPPKGVKLPTDRPALVSETCISWNSRNSKDSQESNILNDLEGTRARAFHVLDPRGVIDTIAVFLETQKELPVDMLEDGFRTDRILGQWEGTAQICRSDLYGGSRETQKSQTTYSIEGDVLSVQSTVGPRKLHINGVLDGNVLAFNGGLETVFLPGGMFFTFPKIVPRGNSFFFEFGWQFPGSNTRQRVVRTYDPDGMVVSTMLVCEEKTS